MKVSMPRMVLLVVGWVVNSTGLMAYGGAVELVVPAQRIIVKVHPRTLAVCGQHDRLVAPALVVVHPVDVERVACACSQPVEPALRCAEQHIVNVCVLADEIRLEPAPVVLRGRVCCSNFQLQFRQPFALAVDRLRAPIFASDSCVDVIALKTVHFNASGFDGVAVGFLCFFLFTCCEECHDCNGE